MKSEFYFMLFLLMATSSCSRRTFEPVSTFSRQEIMTFGPTDYDISKYVTKTPFGSQPYMQKTDQKAADQRVELYRNAQSQRVAGPIGIGLTFVGLKSLLGSLEATIGTVSGQIHAQLTNLLSTANGLAAQWDRRLKNRLTETIDQLNALERRIVEDTESFIRMSQETIRLVEAGAIEAARVAAGEADIVAYNTTTLLVRKKEPRFVYPTPLVFRIGLEEPVVAIRGNFLGFRPYNLKIGRNATELTPLGFSSNQVTVRIPDSYLETITTPTTIDLSAEPWSRKKRLLWWGYKYEKMPTQTVLVSANPRVDYTLDVSITPLASVPTFHTFTYNFYESDENCNANRRVDRLYPLPLGWEIANVLTPPQITINTANCGSGLVGNGASYSGDNAVLVEANLKGCGTNWIFNCKGRGWLGYTVYAPAKSYQYQPIDKFVANVKVPNQIQRTFTFDYPLANIPLDNRGVKYPYRVSILIEEGTIIKRIEISDVNPNAEGVRSRLDNNRLTIEMYPITKILTF